MEQPSPSRAAPSSSEVTKEAGLPHERRLRRGQGLGLIEEIAEHALQFQSRGCAGEHDASGRSRRMG